MPLDCILEKDQDDNFCVLQYILCIFYHHKNTAGHQVKNHCNAVER